LPFFLRDVERKNIAAIMPIARGLKRPEFAPLQHHSLLFDHPLRSIPRTCTLQNFFSGCESAKSG